MSARAYRCLRRLDLGLDEGFHVLVGPNGSGKSTLFDAIEFLFDVIHADVDSAVGKRTRNFQDLVWGRPSESLGLELGMDIDLAAGTSFRYEVAIRESEDGVALESERGFLGVRKGNPRGRRDCESLFDARPPSALKPIFRRVRVPKGTKNGPATRTMFYPEQRGHAIGIHHDPRTPSIRLVSAIHDIWSRSDSPKEGDADDSGMTKTAAAVEQVMRGTVRELQLDSRQLKLASPPNGDATLRVSIDGANLPWVIDTFRAQHRELYESWLRHIRTALPDITGIRTALRDDDRHAYLMVQYESGVEVPSWGISDGTLRLLVLTLLAYLPGDQPTVYLLEEPENGIHPMAIEMVYQSLSSVYGSQVLVASHSPSFLRRVEPREVLCFARDPNGATVVTPGQDHPRLSSWQESVDNDMLFAADILG